MINSQVQINSFRRKSDPTQPKIFKSMVQLWTLFEFPTLCNRDTFVSAPNSIGCCGHDYILLSQQVPSSSFFHLSLPKWDWKWKSLNMCQLAMKAVFSFGTGRGRSFSHNVSNTVKKNVHMLHQSVHLLYLASFTLSSTSSNSCLLIRIEIMGVI